ncbi:MAG TPA: cytochrome P450 [Rhizomicrobium sp.]|nr:cytochrome P450 [Rhizomicrobium sp.]
MTIQQPIDRPVLIGPEVPEKPLSLLKAIKVGQVNPIATIPRAAYRDLMWSSKFFFASALVVNDPVAIKRVLLDNMANYPKAKLEQEILGAAFGEGLLVSEGEKWRAHRRIMSPSFDIRSLTGYAPAMAECADALARRWAELAPGATVDIAGEMTRLTLEIISRTMFSASDAEMGDTIAETMATGQEALSFTVLDFLPVIGPIRVRRALKRIRETFSGLDGSMRRLIESRAASPAEAPRDLLDRLIAARDSESGIGMDEKEVRDEVVIIFLAGHETTAVAMTFVWYLLSQHPAVEAKLHDELARVLGGRAPEYADLANLPYTRMVIEESMRLYPPAPGLAGREALADDDLNGHKVKKGDMIAIEPWIVHRHEKLWDDPLRFDPERFSPERSAGRPRFAYIPFGGGPHICIGAQLAMLEASLILATLAQRFRPRLAPGQDIELVARITLRPRDGMKMMLDRR